ncbi:MAG: GNAT family N-acetyltransferase [Acidimicrobiia bacterium]
MSLTFRTASPADVDAVLPLIYSSGPAAFDYIFSTGKKKPADFLRRAIPTGKGEFGYHTHTVVIQRGVVVGAGATFTGGGLGEMMTLAGQIAGTYKGSAPSVIARGLKFERIVTPPKKGEHCIAHLGVDPEVQSNGIGTELIERLLDDGRRLGRQRAVLDVSVENPRAQELYERLGFLVTEQTESSLSNEYATVPAHRRMELEL